MKNEVLDYKQIQINNWLDSILESIDNELKYILSANTYDDIEPDAVLDKVRSLYSLINILYRVETGKTVINGTLHPKKKEIINSQKTLIKNRNQK